MDIIYRIICATLLIWNIVMIAILIGMIVNNVNIGVIRAIIVFIASVLVFGIYFKIKNISDIEYIEIIMVISVLNLLTNFIYIIKSLFHKPNKFWSYERER